MAFTPPHSQPNQQEGLDIVRAVLTLGMDKAVSGVRVDRKGNIIAPQHQNGKQQQQQGAKQQQEKQQKQKPKQQRQEERQQQQQVCAALEKHPPQEAPAEGVPVAAVAVL